MSFWETDLLGDCRSGKLPTGKILLEITSGKLPSTVEYMTAK